MIQSRLRIVTIGDETVGKTCLLSFLMGKNIPTTYRPTTYENFCVDRTICGHVVTFSLRDTAGRSSFDDFRSIVFGGTDVFLLCYSKDNRNSFSSLQEKWIREAKKSVHGAKMILVQTKSDISEEKSQVSDKEAEFLFYEEDLDGFVKTSAIKGEQSQNILELCSKLCALKKKWIPPIRRRQSKS
ncbi:Rho-related protein racF2 [Tritrichomonas foetus]|uniref:Rho-related protein racF2 n=1 Tax=Tritrichomonas foetus TaxID=1144522 RepID=A0A1J4KDZ1_9EUKA|nr:Rho-related protein racF2 [Tritrichomonas foetus]|eukprot:OHT09210.1 Rho-related protein racF2 [Tritrichomonas foetus]